MDQVFSSKQREMFAQVLQESRKREEAGTESKSDDDRVEAEVISKLAEEKGASELIAKVRQLRWDLDGAANELERLGFDCDEDSISLHYDAPEAMTEAVEKAKRAARKEREAALKKYDLAILGVWAAKDVETAKAIVEKALQ